LPNDYHTTATTPLALTSVNHLTWSKRLHSESSIPVTQIAQLRDWGIYFTTASVV
jgi:hypothetical protein